MPAPLRRVPFKNAGGGASCQKIHLTFRQLPITECNKINPLPNRLTVNDSETPYGKFQNVKSLPSPPQVLIRLLDACNDNQATPRDLADIVFKDPSICSKILQLINSSFMGLREKITDLEKALIYLGADTIKNVAVSASVFQVFRQTKGDSRFNLSHFWWHSVMCATLAKRIAKKTGYASADEAFLSGMLHDIGQLLLWVNFKNEYGAALEATGGDMAALIAKEREIGTTHYALGAWLVRQWRLNSLMADAILYHHEELHRVAEAFPLVKIVYLANILAHCKTADDPLAQSVARTLFHFDLPQLQEILSGAREEVSDVAGSLGIPADAPEPAPAHEEKTDAHEAALAAAVKQLSLMYGTLQNLLKASGRNEIIETASRGFQILFGVPRFFFFVHDPEADLLRGHSALPADGGGPEEDLILSCKENKSLLAGCFATGTQFNTFAAPAGSSLTIADEQILRLLNTRGMMYVPLTAERTPVGIIAVGISEAQAKKLLGQSRLLDLFTAHTGMCLHVDHMKQVQAGRIQSERLEASATVARKVVHEVNNPLSIIKNYLKILGLKLPEKHPAQSELAVIGEEIDRVSQIIGGLRDYASPKVSAFEEVDINGLLSSILTIADNSILKPAMIHLHFTPDPDLPVIQSQKNGLKQVILNLVKNAAEAMPEGGNILVSTRTNHAADDGGTPPASVEILIRDDGPGIPENIRQHLFEPFHSSKKDGHSGLGLSIVRNIVKELGGTIACNTSPKTGTTFKITLPAASKEFTGDPEA